MNTDVFYVTGVQELLYAYNHQIRNVKCQVMYNHQ